MRRLLLLTAAAAAACDQMQTPPDPNVASPAFSPQLCTAGSAGDPTCPLNVVALDSLGAPGARLEFLAKPLGANALSITNMVASSGAAGLFAAGIWLEPTPCNTLEQGIGMTIDLGANTIVELTDLVVPSGAQMCMIASAIGPSR